MCPVSAGLEDVSGLVGRGGGFHKAFELSLTDDVFEREFARAAAAAFGSFFWLLLPWNRPGAGASGREMSGISVGI